MNSRLTQSTSPAVQRAYVVALCLQATSVLAELPQGEEVAEKKALLDQIMDAVSNPSSEHFTLYLGMGLVLAIVAAIVFSAFGKEQPTQGISSDDLGIATEEPKPSKKAKGKVVQEDAVTTEGLNVSELQKALDQSDPFMRTATGSLDLESIVRFKAIITRFTSQGFKARKEEMLQERIRMLKNQRLQEYSKLVVMGQQEFQKALMTCTQTAAEFIGLDQNQFVASIQAAMGDKDTQIQFKENDERIHREMEKTVELTLEQAKIGLADRTKYEKDSQAKMQRMPRPTNQQEVQQYQTIMMLERTRIIDMIYIEHGIKMHDLVDAVEKYKLQPKVTEESMPAEVAEEEAESVQNDEAEAEEPKKESIHEKEIKALVAAVELDLTPNEDGNLSEDTFWKVMEIIGKMHIRYAHRIVHDSGDQRRNLMKADLKAEYANAVQEVLMETSQSKQKVVMAVFAETGITAQVFQKTSQAMMSTSTDNQQQMQAIMAKLEISERSELMGEGYTPLTRDVALEIIKKVEEKKVEFVAGMIIMANTGQFPREKLEMGQEMSKYQALDELYDELKIEESDIIIAVQLHKLNEDQEFVAMIKKLQGVLQSRVEEGVQQIRLKAAEEEIGKKAAREAEAAAMGQSMEKPRVFGEGSLTHDGEEAEDLGW